MNPRQIRIMDCIFLGLVYAALAVGCGAAVVLWAWDEMRKPVPVSAPGARNADRQP